MPPVVKRIHVQVNTIDVYANISDHIRYLVFGPGKSRRVAEIHQHERLLVCQIGRKRVVSEQPLRMVVGNPRSSYSTLHLEPQKKPHPARVCRISHWFHSVGIACRIRIPCPHGIPGRHVRHIPAHIPTSIYPQCVHRQVIAGYVANRLNHIGFCCAGESYSSVR